MNPSDLTVIIPTYRRRELVLRNLPGVRQAAPPETHILVADQTRPADGTFEHQVKAAGADYLWLPKAGLPFARNQGMAVIPTPAAVFLDDDAEPKTGWLEAFGRKLGQYPCVTGRIWDRDLNLGDQVYSFDLRTGEYRINVSLDRGQEVFSLSGGNFAVTREAWRRAGRFHEGFRGPANWEEVDFARRLRRAGGAIWYEPAAEVIHRRPGSGGCQAETRPARYHAARYFNDGLFFGRNPGILPWKAVWHREKHNIEFYTRGKSGGRDWARVAGYFGAFFCGFASGKLRW